ncbi:MAG: MBL fold metallo-hydrolase [Ignavibacteriales bacterium]|nr:MBL fold metallo-hydrolase [Ignavibacteriales bacterium]
MNINRRNFIKGSSLLFGSFLVQGNKSFPFQFPESNNLQLVGKSVGIYVESGGTIGWYVDGDTIVVIDTQFPENAKNFKSGLDSKSSVPINYLFNTHHHNDHTMGNFYLKQFTQNIIAHENCPRLQIKSNKGTDKENQVITADITFKDELKVKLPKENITAKYFGQAHTSGDIVIHFENENIAHLGDLVFNNLYPYIDNNGESSVENWIVTLSKIENYFDNNSKFIFGHANDNNLVTGKKSDITKMRNYLENLYNYVAKLLKDGKNAEEIAELNTIPGFDNLLEKWPGARKMNLSRTAEQLIK